MIDQAKYEILLIIDLFFIVLFYILLVSLHLTCNHVSLLLVLCIKSTHEETLLPMLYTEEQFVTHL